MYIGEIIKSYREQHNMTVEEFANKSNLSQAEITNWKNYFKAMEQHLILLQCDKLKV